MEKRKRVTRTILIIIAIIAICVIAWCGWYIYQYWQGNKLGEQLKDNWTVQDIEISEEGKAVEIPVDFDALWEVNPEIYAWIYVPGTNISYPVLQHDGDNSYYIRRSEKGVHYTGGCIFSENYNSKDFTDRMTLIYGHNLRSGKAFAQLNDFADVNVFENNRYIVIYTPEKELIYEIFAAYPHSHEHLLLEHDFNNREEFDSFFNEVMQDKNLNANFLEDTSPDFDADKILTLSTCFRGTNQMRYLVQGRLIVELPAKK